MQLGRRHSEIRPRPRSRLGRSALGATLFILASCSLWGRPNLLVVSIDTLRADRLGAYGYANARTPRFDALAQEGVRFNRAFTPVPLTLPAHCSLFTGAYPPSHGVRDNASFRLDGDQTTLAELMRTQGYATGASLGAFVLDSKFGLDQGFEHYDDNFDLSASDSLSPGYIQRPGGEVVDRAVQWLSTVANRPFFLWVHLYDPHDPYEAPEPYPSRHPGRPYDAEIEYADAQLGRLLDWLRERNLYQSTLIVVVGDHGESLGDHGELKHGFFIYNSVLHVPMLFRFPGGDNAGRVVEEDVSLVDVLPTISQILRLPRSDSVSVQGAGLLSLILGKRGPSRPGLYAESYYPRLQFGWSQLRALISGGHKFILSPKPELYDLKGDFAESSNLVSKQQALSNRLEQDFTSWLGRLEPAGEGSGARSTIDAETLSKLSSLGYVALSAGAGLAGDFRELSDPKDQIGVYNRIGRLLEMSSQGRFVAAIPDYQALLKEQPNLKLVRYKLGQAFYETGRLQEALDQFKALVEFGEGESLATFDLAMTYFRLEKFEEAAAGFDLVLRLDPSHPRARTNLGVCYKNLGRIAQAISELERAVAESPDDVLALGNLGVSYSMAERHGDALRSLERAVELAPDNALLHANLGSAYGRMGDREKAQEQFEIARRLNPDLFPRRQ